MDRDRTVALNGARDARRRAHIGTKALALASFALAVAAVVEISLGRV